VWGRRGGDGFLFEFSELVGPEKHFNNLLGNVLGTILAGLDCKQNLPVYSKALQSASMKPTS
jgi:hypothetical protein